VSKIMEQYMAGVITLDEMIEEGAVARTVGAVAAGAAGAAAGAAIGLVGAEVGAAAGLAAAQVVQNVSANKTLKDTPQGKQYIDKLHKLKADIAKLKEKKRATDDIGKKKDIRVDIKDKEQQYQALSQRKFEYSDKIKRAQKAAK